MKTSSIADVDEVFYKVEGSVNEVSVRAAYEDIRGEIPNLDTVSRSPLINV